MCSGNAGCKSGKSSIAWGTPPPPIPLDALLGAGSAKTVCKILMSNNLEVKILSAKELWLALCEPLYSIRRIDNEPIQSRAQGWMSHAGCGKDWSGGGTSSAHGAAASKGASKGRHYGTHECAP